MGLTSEADLLDLRAMDTSEDVIVQFIEHEMHYPNGAGGRLRLLPRSQWRFKAEFSDGSTKWMQWAEANQMAALDVYAAKHKRMPMNAGMSVCMSTTCAKVELKTTNPPPLE